MQLQSRLFGSEIDKYGRIVRKTARKNLHKRGRASSQREVRPIADLIPGLAPGIGECSCVSACSCVNPAATVTTVDDVICNPPNRAAGACFVTASVVTPSECMLESSSVPKGLAHPDAATGSTFQKVRRRLWYPSVKEWVGLVPRIYSDDSSLEQAPRAACDDRHLRPPVHAMTILLGATTSYSPPHSYQRHLRVSLARLCQVCGCCCHPLSAPSHEQYAHKTPIAVCSLPVDSRGNTVPRHP